MGYISSDWKEDRDEEEILEDEAELRQEFELIRKILKGEEELSLAEMETVSYSVKLRDVYNDRWWRPDLPCFFAQIDNGLVTSKSG